MELYKTYLKYNKSITKDVFNRIISKLGDVGIHKDKANPRNLYSEFSSEYGVLKIFHEGWYLLFDTDFCKREIQVADILGEGWDVPTNTQHDARSTDKKDYSVGDWVCANGHGHTNGNKSFPTGVAWKIEKLKPEVVGDKVYVVVDRSSTIITGHTTNTNAIRHATPEEIAKAKGEEDTWYVQATSDNLDVITEWHSKIAVVYRVGSYYGLNKGQKDQWAKHVVVDDPIITTEQFYEKIGHKPKSSKKSVKKATEETCTNTNGYGLNDYREGCTQHCDDCEYYEKAEEVTTREISVVEMKARRKGHSNGHIPINDLTKPRVTLIRKRKLSITTDNEVKIKIKKR